MKIIPLFCLYNERVHQPILAVTKRPVTVCGILHHHHHHHHRLLRQKAAHEIQKTEYTDSMNIR